MAALSILLLPPSYPLPLMVPRDAPRLALSVTLAPLPSQFCCGTLNVSGVACVRMNRTIRPPSGTVNVWSLGLQCMAATPFVSSPVPTTLDTRLLTTTNWRHLYRPRRHAQHSTRRASLGCPPPLCGASLPPPLPLPIILCAESNLSPPCMHAQATTIVAADTSRLMSVTTAVQTLIMVHLKPGSMAAIATTCKGGHRMSRLVHPRDPAPWTKHGNGPEKHPRLTHWSLSDHYSIRSRRDLPVHETAVVLNAPPQPTHLSIIINSEAAGTALDNLLPSLVKLKQLAVTSAWQRGSANLPLLANLENMPCLEKLHLHVIAPGQAEKLPVSLRSFTFDRPIFSDDVYATDTADNVARLLRRVPGLVHLGLPKLTDDILRSIVEAKECALTSVAIEQVGACEVTDPDLVARLTRITRLDISEAELRAETRLALAWLPATVTHLSIDASPTAWMFAALTTDDVRAALLLSHQHVTVYKSSLEHGFDQFNVAGDDGVLVPRTASLTETMAGPVLVRHVKVQRAHENTWLRGLPALVETLEVVFGKPESGELWMPTYPYNLREVRLRDCWNATRHEECVQNDIALKFLDRGSPLSRLAIEVVEVPRATIGMGLGRLRRLPALRSIYLHAMRYRLDLMLKHTFWQYSEYGTFDLNRDLAIYTWRGWWLEFNLIFANDHIGFERLEHIYGLPLFAPADTDLTREQLRAFIGRYHDCVLNLINCDCYLGVWEACRHPYWSSLDDLQTAIDKWLAQNAPVCAFCERGDWQGSVLVGDAIVAHDVRASRLSDQARRCRPGHGDIPLSPFPREVIPPVAV
jgi:hypothetical protein